MIRPFTCVCLVLAAGAGMYLYQVKQRAFALDASLRTTFHEIDVARERTRMLRADWALVNDPERLQTLASQYLHLQPMQPAQLMTMDQLAAALPPPDAAPPVPAVDPTQGMPMAATTPPAPTPGQPPAPEIAMLRPSTAAVVPAAQLPPSAPPVAAPSPAAVVAVQVQPPARPIAAPPPAHHAPRHPAPAAPMPPRLAASSSSSQPGRTRHAYRHVSPRALPPAQLYAANTPTHLPEPPPRIIPRAATVMYSPAVGSSLGMAASATLAPPRPLYTISQ